MKIGRDKTLMNKGSALMISIASRRNSSVMEYSTMMRFSLVFSNHFLAKGLQSSKCFCLSSSGRDFHLSSALSKVVFFLSTAILPLEFLL